MSRLSSLPEIVVQHGRDAYRNGDSLKTVSRTLNIPWRQLYRALRAAGEPIRARGWPVGHKSTKESCALVPFEDRLAAGLAAEAKRTQAIINRLDHRCSACAGIIRAGIPHNRCRGLDTGRPR